MIKSTFICIPGIGEKTEEYLWSKGILTWDIFRKKNRVRGLSINKRKLIEEYLDKMEKEFYRYHASFFAKYLPGKEYWRIYKDYLNKTLFLDIETTGLSLYYDKITVIGTFDGNEIKIFIKDSNLEEILDYIQNYEILITFNGKLFDVPFIKKAFPDIRIPPLHIDLRYLLRNLGIKGSLKNIEKKLAIIRPDCLQETNGKKATVLWNKFIRGDDKALEELILYNIYDVINLKYLMDFCYIKKFSQIKNKLIKDERETILFYLDDPFYHSSQKKFNKSIIKRNYNLKLLSKHNIPKKITPKRLNSIIEGYLDDEILYRIDRKKIETVNVDLNYLIQEIRKNSDSCVSVGIDLSGSEKRASGFCLLQENNVYLAALNTNKEIISKTLDAEPAIISIDSPLSLPTGRCCVDDSCECRKFGIIRECERILKKRGINSYPCLIKSMQKLTKRGIELSDIFKEQGFKVIESYPGAAQDILWIPRKRVDLEELENALKNIGINIFLSSEKVTHDELDAITCALVGYYFLANSYEALGNKDEGYLIIPKL